MDFHGNSIGNFILNLISFVCNVFACLLSTIVLIIIIHHLYHNRINRQDKIVLILSSNIYLYIFMFDIVQVQFSIYTLLGDLYGMNFDTSLVRFNGYIIPSLLSSLYYVFVVQGFYRLCCIVYSRHRHVQFYWLYVLMIPMELFISSIVMCPLLVWNDIIYLSNEYYSFILFTNIRATLCIIINAYVIPLVFLSCIYFRIILFIRQQTTNQLLVIKRNHQRDLLAIRRIFLTISLLFVLAIPTAFFVLMAYITRQEHPLTHRATMLSYSMSMALLTVQTIFVTPQLKSLFIKIWQANRVLPAGANFVNQNQIKEIAITK